MHRKCTDLKSCRYSLRAALFSRQIIPPLTAAAADEKFRRYLLLARGREKKKRNGLPKKETMSSSNIPNYDYRAYLTSASRASRATVIRLYPS